MFNCKDVYIETQHPLNAHTGGDLCDILRDELLQLCCVQSAWQVVAYIEWQHNFKSRSKSLVSTLGIMQCIASERIAPGVTAVFAADPHKHLARLWHATHEIAVHSS